MDVLKPMTPTQTVIAGDDDGIPESQPSPKVNGSVVLAQPAITLLPPVSKTSVVTVDVDSAQSQKDGGTLANALNV